MEPNEKISLFLVHDDYLFSKALGHCLSQKKTQVTSFNLVEGCMRNLDLKPTLKMLNYFLGSNNKKNGFEALINIRTTDLNIKEVMLSGYENITNTQQLVADK